MERVAALGRRFLPRGWAHLGLQVALWVGFSFAYLFVRSLTARDHAAAIANGLRVIDLERRLTHHLVELSLQRIADSSHVLLVAAAWTYWNSEFTVIAAALLWVYLRRHERFARFRNTILLANVLGLVGYVVLPTAPPWMFASQGFVPGIDAAKPMLQALDNPYAAMPSLHAADALVVGLFLALSCRTRWAKALWMLWPTWVWFCVIATANHFLLDVLAGIGVAVLSFAATAWTLPLLQRTRDLAIANLL